MRFVLLLLSAGVALNGVQAAPAPGGDLELFNKRTITSISCDPFLDNTLWWGAYNEGIPPAIAEIRKRKGNPKSLAPHTCRRGACNTLNSAVYFCNDGDKEVTISSYSEAAKAAQVVHDKCKGSLPGFDGAYVGHGFDTAGWKVLIRWDVCEVQRDTL